jgi:hypothetical protein
MSSQPWDRQRRDGKLEPMLWFGRFNVYREMGTERSLLGAVNIVHKSKKKRTSIPGAWSDAHKKWTWKDRAEAWDEHERQRIEAKFREQCDEWRTGRFEDAQKLREKARGYLSFPVSRREVTEGGRAYIIEALPTSYAKDAAAILKIADELARTTTRETLPKVEQDITSGGQPLIIQKVAGFDEV